jgi:hypothetical protein
MPVMLPPGLFKLATKPFSTGSLPRKKTPELIELPLWLALSERSRLLKAL